MARPARPARPTDEAPDVPEGPSKTRRKHEMHALQDLGEQLVALDPSKLAALDLPERLADAVLLARTITRHEARRRQMQYIGRLMRDVDPAPLAAAFKLWNEGPAEARVRFAALERWRTRLLDEPEALDAFMADYPDTPRTPLAHAVADAREERARGGPPHRQRALFRAIKTASEVRPAAGADDDAGEPDA